MNYVLGRTGGLITAGFLNRILEAVITFFVLAFTMGHLGIENLQEYPLAPAIAITASIPTAHFLASLVINEDTRAIYAAGLAHPLLLLLWLGALIIGIGLIFDPRYTNVGIAAFSYSFANLFPWAVVLYCGLKNPEWIGEESNKPS